MVLRELVEILLEIFLDDLSSGTLLVRILILGVEIHEVHFSSVSFMYQLDLAIGYLSLLHFILIFEFKLN